MAEPLKKFLKRRDDVARTANAHKLAAEIERESQPWPDSFPEGQRIRRVRPHVYGYGQIGDLGTVLRFIKRNEDPASALYLVQWDYHPLATAYVRHRDMEAVQHESLVQKFVNVLLDGESPKDFMRRRGIPMPYVVVQHAHKRSIFLVQRPEGPGDHGADIYGKYQKSRSVEHGRTMYVVFEIGRRVAPPGREPAFYQEKDAIQWILDIYKKRRRES